MRPRRASAILVGALVLAMTQQPAHGIHQDTPLLIEAVPLEDNGYVAWRVWAPWGARVGVAATGGMHAGEMRLLGAFMLTLPAVDTPRWSWALDYYGDSRVNVELPAPVGHVIRYRHGGDEVAASSWWETYTVPQSGEYLLVGMLASDGRGFGSVSVHGDAGVVVVSRSEGGSFFHRDYDFRGETSVIVKSIASVRYLRNVSVAEDVEGALIAWFAGGASGQGRIEMGFDGPGVSGSGGTYYRIHPGSSGAYRFWVRENVDHTVVCTGGIIPLCQPPEIWLWGADVRVPPAAGG